MAKTMVAEYIPDCEIENELASLKLKADSIETKTIKQEDDDDALNQEQQKLIKSAQHEFKDF